MTINSGIIPFGGVTQIYHKKAKKGLLGDTRKVDTIRCMNGTEDTIPYGVGVVRNENAEITMPTATSTAADFGGVTLLEYNRDAVGGIPVRRDATLLSKGSIYVELLEDVEFDDDVYWRVGETGNGNFCKSAGEGETLSVKLNYKYKYSAKSGEIIKLELFYVGQ